MGTLERAMGGENEEDRKKKQGGNFPFHPPCVILRFSVYTTHRVPATGTVALGAAQNGLGNKKKKENNKHVGGIFGASASQGP